MNIAERLVAKRRGLTSRKIIRQVMAWVLYIDLPWNVEIGEGFQLLHRGAGVIIHPATKIGKNVTIAPYSGTGQLYPMDPWPIEEWPKVIVEDDVFTHSHSHARPALATLAPAQAGRGSSGFAVDPERDQGPAPRRVQPAAGDLYPELIQDS